MKLNLITLNKKLVYYIDMDGVLADFNAEPNGVARFSIEPKFFRTLRPIITNLMAVNILLLKGYKVKILSASPNENADKDKIEWLSKYLPKLKIKNIILCRNGEVKADYVKNIKKSVLFDDYGLNCREWRANGGVAHKVRDRRMMLRMVGE
jgi:5'(3')-deoxyribonucleotidase